MTNPTPHGQVPEALIDLIDAYAETRHRCGGIYNARTEAARNAVIEALSGVQALSAAPVAFLKSVIALCSHRGYSPANIELWDKDDKWIADLWRQAESMLTTSPTPPAEQQAKLGAVYAELPKRRRQFLCTKCGSRECKVGTINEQHPPCECGYLGFAEDLDFNADEMRDFADRTHALRMQQAAPKAAPGELSADSLRHQNKLLAETLGACILASGIVRKDIDGFTGPELLHFGEDLRSMLEVAPKQEVQEPTQEMVDAVMSLVDLEVSDPEDHRYDDGSKLAAQICRAVLALAPQQEAQEPCPTCVALARTVMLDQVSFDRKPDCYGIRQITDDEGVEEWEDIRTSPDVAREEANDMMATGRGEIYEVVPLWTTPQHAPQPAPAPLSEMPYEKRKAIQEGEQIGASDAWFKARHEMLDTVDRRNVFRAGFDRGWNAALAAQGGKV